MPSVVLDSETNITREKLQAAFTAENIDARVFFHPMSSLSMFESQPENMLAWSIPGRAINLPGFHDITVAQQDCVINVMTKMLESGM
jgi:perosamine synthetase